MVKTTMRCKWSYINNEIKIGNLYDYFDFQNMIK